MTEIICRILR